MKTYRLAPAYYAALKRRLLLTAVPIICIAGAIGYLAGLLQKGSTLPTTLLFMGLTGVFFVFTIPRSYRQQRDLAQSYLLIVNGDSITRKQEGAQDIYLTKNGIARITETPDKGLGIISINSKQRFGIPATLEGYDDLRRTLAAWHAIQTVKPKKMYWQALVVPFLALVLIGLFAVAVISTDKVLVTAAGGLALIMSVGSAIVIWKNPQVDAKTRSKLWLASIPLVALIAKIIYTLVN